MPIRSNNATPMLLALAVALFILSTLLAAMPHTLIMRLLGITLYGVVIAVFVS